MQIIWTIEDQTPLSRPAVELGVRALAGRLGAEVDDTAVVMLQDEGILGGYPLARAFGPDGSSVWMADYRAVAGALFGVADEALRRAGLDPAEPTFERQARRLIKRRFPHWPEASVTELLSVLPRLQNLALALEGRLDLDDPDH